MPQMPIEQMRKLIERLDQAKQLDANIPQGMIDRLERSAQLLNELKNMRPINWDAISTEEDIERAEASIHEKKELKDEIERHLATCGLTVPSRGRVVATKERKRQPRRSKDQLEYDRLVKEITKAKKAELNLNPRGRLTPGDQAKLDAALEKEFKRQKLTPPKGY